MTFRDISLHFRDLFVTFRRKGSEGPPKNRRSFRTSGSGEAGRQPKKLLWDPLRGRGAEPPFRGSPEPLPATANLPAELPSGPNRPLRRAISAPPSELQSGSSPNCPREFEGVEKTPRKAGAVSTAAAPSGPGCVARTRPARTHQEKSWKRIEVTAA